MLDQSKHLVQMGREAAQSLIAATAPNGRFRDADLWILMQGFAGGFYAVWETLHNVEQQGDDILRQALTEWREDNRAAYENRAAALRRMLSHQGKHFTTIPTIAWEVDDLNDTVVPVTDHVFATRTDTGGNVREISFGAWANSIFWWWESQLAEIERLYNRKKRLQPRSGKAG